jgi:hypothetical protein
LFCEIFNVCHFDSFFPPSRPDRRDPEDGY